ncbi:MAG: DUF6263 family protein [Candidatus Marinimicrobia bacterium]|jgi:hypothetical protein|nr:DUF6263 family protein [Candidatus Neomarinimicrobiota bacterium]
MKKALKIIGIMLVLGFIANCGGDRDHLLRYNVEDGDSYNLTFTMSMEGLLTIEMNMGSTLDIISTNDNEIVTRTSFNSISMDMSMSGESVSYDSRNPGGSEFSNTMHKLLSPMLSAKLETTFNDRGSVLKAPDFASIFDNNPDLQAQMSDMTKQMENMFVEYPEKALKIGESFNYGLKNDEVTYTSVLTLTEVTDTEYIFKITGDVSASSGGQDVTGTMTGTQTFFRESCMPKSTDTTVEMEVSGMTWTIESSMEMEKY